MSAYWIIIWSIAKHLIQLFIFLILWSNVLDTFIKLGGISKSRIFFLFHFYFYVQLCVYVFIAFCLFALFAIWVGFWINYRKSLPASCWAFSPAELLAEFRFLVLKWRYHKYLPHKIILLIKKILKHCMPVCNIQ